MKFISPVPLMEGIKNDVGWVQIDLTPYIPVTATFVVFEIEAMISGVDETESFTEESKLVCRASGDPHRLRVYNLLSAAPSSSAKRLIISDQALGPVGEGMMIDLRVLGPGFSGGVTCNLVAYMEECPTVSVEG